MNKHHSNIGGGSSNGNHAMSPTTSGVSASSSSSASSSRYPVVCKYFKSGTCKLGDSCRFAHTSGSVPSSPSTSGTSNNSNSNSSNATSNTSLPAFSLSSDNNSSNSGYVDGSSNNSNSNNSKGGKYNDSGNNKTMSPMTVASNSTSSSSSLNTNTTSSTTLSGQSPFLQAALAGAHNQQQQQQQGNLNNQNSSNSSSIYNNSPSLSNSFNNLNIASTSNIVLNGLSLEDAEEFISYHCRSSPSKMAGRRPFLQLVVLYASDSRVMRFAKEVQGMFLDGGIDVFLKSDDNGQSIKTENLAEIITNSKADCLVVLGDRNLKNKSCQAKRRGKLVEMDIEEVINCIWAEWTQLLPKEEEDITDEQVFGLLEKHCKLRHVKDRLTKLKLSINEFKDMKIPTRRNDNPSFFDEKIASKLTTAQKGVMRFHQQVVEAVDYIENMPYITHAEKLSSTRGSAVGPDDLSSNDSRPITISENNREKLLDQLHKLLPKIEALGDVLSDYGAPLSDSYFDDYHSNNSNSGNGNNKPSNDPDESVDLKPGQWRCLLCTYINNEENKLNCAMCDNPQNTATLSGGNHSEWSVPGQKKPKNKLNIQTSYQKVEETPSSTSSSSASNSITNSTKKSSGNLMMVQDDKSKKSDSKLSIQSDSSSSVSTTVKQQPQQQQPLSTVSPSIINTNNSNLGVLMVATALPVSLSTSAPSIPTIPSSANPLSNSQPIPSHVSLLNGTIYNVGGVVSTPQPPPSTPIQTSQTNIATNLVNPEQYEEEYPSLLSTGKTPKKKPNPSSVNQGNQSPPSTSPSPPNVQPSTTTNNNNLLQNNSINLNNTFNASVQQQQQVIGSNINNININNNQPLVSQLLSSPSKSKFAPYIGGNIVNSNSTSNQPINSLNNNINSSINSNSNSFNQAPTSPLLTKLQGVASNNTGNSNGGINGFGQYYNIFNGTNSWDLNGGGSSSVNSGSNSGGSGQNVFIQDNSNIFGGWSSPSFGPSNYLSTSNPISNTSSSSPIITPQSSSSQTSSVSSLFAPDLNMFRNTQPTVSSSSTQPTSEYTSASTLYTPANHFNNQNNNQNINNQNNTSNNLNSNTGNGIPRSNLSNYNAFQSNNQFSIPSYNNYLMGGNTPSSGSSTSNSYLSFQQQQQSSSYPSSVSSNNQQHVVNGEILDKEKQKARESVIEKYRYSMNPPQRPCCYCGEESILECYNCAKIGYATYFCTKEHQSLMWKEHLKLHQNLTNNNKK